MWNLWLQKKVWQQHFFSPLSFVDVFGSGINIPDPQHCLQLLFSFGGKYKVSRFVLVKTTFDKNLNFRCLSRLGNKRGWKRNMLYEHWPVIFWGMGESLIPLLSRAVDLSGQNLSMTGQVSDIIFLLWLPEATNKLTLWAVFLIRHYAKFTLSHWTCKNHIRCFGLSYFHSVVLRRIH